MKKLMEIMHTLGVHTQQPGMNVQPFPQPHLTFVQGVSLSGEAGITSRLPVSVTNTQCRVEFVGRQIENHDIVSEVHVAVRIDPRRTNNVFIPDDWAAHYSMLRRK